MAKPTGKQIVECFERYKAEGWGYVWGAQGEEYTQALANEWHNRALRGSKSVPGGRNKNTYYIGDCSKWIGHRVADCSGGIVCAVREYDPNYADRSSSGFKSQFTESGKINTLPEIPGLALWKSGHIGIYKGNGKALEFRGTAYGCVETNVSERPWTHWGKIYGVVYGDAPVEEVKPGVPFFATCSGGSVNVRAGRSSTTKILGVARKGDKLFALPAVNGWCEVAVILDKKMVMGYMTERYVKEISP